MSSGSCRTTNEALNDLTFANVSRCSESTACVRWQCAAVVCSRLCVRRSQVAAIFCSKACEESANAPPPALCLQRAVSSDTSPMKSARSRLRSDACSSSIRRRASGSDDDAGSWPRSSSSAAIWAALRSSAVNAASFSKTLCAASRSPSSVADVPMPTCGTPVALVPAASPPRRPTIEARPERSAVSCISARTLRSAVSVGTSTASVPLALSCSLSSSRCSSPHLPHGCTTSAACSDASDAAAPRVWRLPSAAPTVSWATRSFENAASKSACAVLRLASATEQRAFHFCRFCCSSASAAPPEASKLASHMPVIAQSAGCSTEDGFRE
mmetsp:Transcript_85304/g.244976  ORF Transcript_85304/g.244976 Transcript_85304/m.244976 type:complete len:327 (-) Transcript_85304:1680-2660(-)